MLQNNRLVHLDVIKGLAILFVIIHHGLNTPIIPEVIDSYHMPLFVFVSGILSARKLTFSWEKATQYWRRKFLQLLLPLFSIIPLSVYLNGASGASFFTQCSSAITGEYKAGYWFTFALFIMLLIQYLTRIVAYMMDRHRIQWRYMELSLMALPIPILLGLRYVIPESLIELLSFYHISWLYPYLVLGFIVGRYQRVERWFINDKLSGILMLVYIIGFNLVVNKSNVMSLAMFPWSLFILIFTYSSIHRFTSFATSAVSLRITSILSELGRHSLGIYLVHFFFLPRTTAFKGVYSILQSLETLSKISLWAETLLAVIVAATTCVMSYVVVRIIKNNRFLSQVLLGEA